ncbi:synaptic vesicle glycoprotein 2C-like isoform X2 [Amphiura filiformis]|uniref:synaptic vesicle glycoprotein 2C-like isoform X2 n=1 Tax=Amphiura filiformis TaxID=82378 RepID=UPI003B2138EC
MEKVRDDDNEICTNSGLFEDIVLRRIGPIDNMDSTDEYERLIPEENGKRNGNELAPNVEYSNEDNGNYDEAVEAAGIGKFTWLLAFVCGWANASDSVEIVSVSFLLPAAEQDLNLSSTDKGVLNSIIFVGMLVGSLLWGSLADIQGRRKVLIYSLSVNALFGLLSSFAQEFWLFLILRFFSGVGVGGSVPAIFSYFGEFQMRQRRGMMISIVATFWLAGNILTAGLAWAIIPSNLGTDHDEDSRFNYESWRVFVAFCTIPSATSVLTFLVLPESPKFLLETGRAEEALEVMRKVFVWNNMGTKLDYPIAVLLPSSKSKTSTIDETKKRSIRACCTETGAEIVTIIKANIKLFLPPLTRVSVAMNVIIFCLAFGFYGLWMWFPQLFQEAETQGSVCVKSGANITKPDNSTGPDTQIYTDAFYTSLANLPGNLITIILMDVVGRKAILCSSLVLSGVGVFFIYLVKTRTQVLIMSCLFSGISVMAWNAISVLGVEMYPTSIRGTALGFQSVSNRIGAIFGNLIFGALIDTNCAIPILTVAAMLAIGGIVTLTLPNTLKISLK